MAERETRHSRAYAVMKILPFPFWWAGGGWAGVCWKTLLV